MQTATLPPPEKLATELEPGSALHRLLFDRSPGAYKDWIESFLTVPDLTQRIVSFILFPQQWLMLEDATGRDLRVKGRQSRTSSLELAVTTRQFTTTWGFTGLCGAHDDATTELFRQRIKHHIDDLRNHGLDYKLTIDNDDELVIGALESRIIFQSGERRIIGRSFTGHRVHFSEVAHWRETVATLMGGLKPSVPGPPHGSIVLESTPRGAEGYFYEEVIDAKPMNPNGIYTIHFYPWWMEPRYRVGDDFGADIIVPTSELQEMLTSFDPTQEEEHLMSRASLTPDRILWRRIRKADLAKTTTPFEQEHPESLEGCFVSVSGNYFSTPDGVDHLDWYRNLVTPPVTAIEQLQYRRTAVRMQGTPLTMWEFPDPTQPYVIFVDCASGEQGERADYTNINVLNALTLHKAARFRARITPGDTGVIAAAIGEFYGNALLGVERGGYGSGCLDRLRELGYPNLYYHYDPMNPKREAKAGIYPTPQMREKLLQTLRSAVLFHTYITRDAMEVAEMSTFDWTKVQGRMKAQAATRGSHDDILMSAAGTLFLAPEARVRRKTTDRGKGDEVIVVGRYGQVLSRERTNPNGPQPWMM